MGKIEGLWLVMINLALDFENVVKMLLVLIVIAKKFRIQISNLPKNLTVVSGI